MFPDAARVFFQTSKYFVTQISYSVACTLINFTFHPPSAHSALVTDLIYEIMLFSLVWWRLCCPLSVQTSQSLFRNVTWVVVLCSYTS